MSSVCTGRLRWGDSDMNRHELLIDTIQKLGIGMMIGGLFQVVLEGDPWSGLLIVAAGGILVVEAFIRVGDEYTMHPSVWIALVILAFGTALAILDWAMYGNDHADPDNRRTQHGSGASRARGITRFIIFWRD